MCLREKTTLLSPKVPHLRQVLHCNNCRPRISPIKEWYHGTTSPSWHSGGCTMAFTQPVKSSSPLTTSISTLMHIHHHNSNTFTFNRNNFICSMSPVLHIPHHNLNTFTFKQNVFVLNPLFFWMYEHLAASFHRYFIHSLDHI